MGVSYSITEKRYWLRVNLYCSLDNSMWFTNMYGTEGLHNILKGEIIKI